MIKYYLVEEKITNKGYYFKYLYCNKNLSIINDYYLFLQKVCPEKNLLILKDVVYQC